MNENSYVGPAPGGGFVVVTPGNQPQYFNNQTQAERAYNDLTGQPNEPATRGPNPNADNLARQLANQAAQQAYQDARLQLDRDQFNYMKDSDKEKLAFQKAQQAWTEKYQTSMLTGYLDGTPTLERELAQQNFGLKQGDLTGYYNDKPTLARETEQNRTALGYLNLLAGLRGPKDYFQYLKVLNGTPQGMRDLVSAAAGQYVLPGYGGGVNIPVERASLQGLVNDVAGGGTQYVESPILPAYRGPGAKPLSQAGNGYLGPLVQDGGQTGQTGQYGDLVNPNQWNARNYFRMAPTQRDLLYGLYEDQKSMRPEDAQHLFQQSLPKYQGPQAGAVTMG